jgi:hypothetical protein
MLRGCDGDYCRAFARYQESLMPLLRHKQASAARSASSFVPRTRLGLAFRNVVMRLLGVPFIAEYFLGRGLRDDLRLPDIPGAPAVLPHL